MAKHDEIAPFRNLKDALSLLRLMEDKDLRKVVMSDLAALESKRLEINGLLGTLATKRAIEQAQRDVAEKNAAAVRKLEQVAAQAAKIIDNAEASAAAERDDVRKRIVAVKAREDAAKAREQTVAHAVDEQQIAAGKLRDREEAAAKEDRRLKLLEERIEDERAKIKQANELVGG